MHRFCNCGRWGLHAPCLAWLRRLAPALLLAALAALPTLAEAQPLPGVGWQPAAGEIRYGFAQAPSCTTPRRLAPQHDPFAVAGDPMALRDLDLSVPAVRRAYGLRYGATTAELDAGVECWRGGMNGAPHGVGARHRLEEAFAAGKLGAAGQWTGAANRREIEDVTNSGGEWCRLLAMVGLTCAAAGGPADGWHRAPLLDLPMEWRPPNLRGAPKLYRGTAPADGCAWVSAHARLSPPKPPDLYVVNRPACFAGLPVDCQSVATLRPECWSAPTPGPVCGDGTCEPPEGPGSCPADCPPEPPVAPVIDVELLGCDGEWWRIRGRYRGESEWMVTAKPGEPAELRVHGELVFRFAPTAPCVAGCPAAEVLGRVRAEVCEW